MHSYKINKYSRLCVVMDDQQAQTATSDMKNDTICTTHKKIGHQKIWPQSEY